MKKFTLDELIFYTLCLFAFSVIFSVTVVEAALLLALGLLLAKKYKESTLGDIRPALTGHQLFKPWLAYLGICLLTSLTAYYPLKGLGQLNSDFLKFVCLFTLFLTVKKERLPALSGLYIAAAVVSAFIGIGQVAHIFPSNFDYASVRANALMNAVRYSEVMTIAFMLILARLVIPVKETFRLEMTFYKVAALLVFSSILLSQTRGAYLGLIAGLLAMLYFSGPHRKRVAACAGLMLVITALLMTANTGMRSRLLAMSVKKTSEISGNTPSVAINTRLALWKLGLKMFKKHPVLGIGPDNVKPVFTRFQQEQIGIEKTWGSLHSLYLHQAAERGLLGLGALLFLFAAMFNFARERYRAVKSPYALWALCALPAYYVVNLTEISFQHVHTSFAIFLALAFAAAAGEERLNG